MADFYGVQDKTIRLRLNRLGIKPKPLITEEQRQEIIDAYDTASSSELAKKYNVSQSWINGIWLKAGKHGKPCRSYYFNEDYFENIEREDQAYWLGFLAADGCVYKPKDNRQSIVSISLEITDKYLLENFTKCLNTNKPVSVVSNKNHPERKYANLQLSSNKMVSDLAKYGIHPRKTYDDNWPTNIPEKLIPSYIRGYFDGDGCISKHFTPNTLHKVNISIAGFEINISHFVDYLATQNINAKLIRDKRGKGRNESDHFVVLYFTNKNERQKFLHLIYDNATIYMDRKYNLAQQFFKYCEISPKTWTIDKKIDDAVC